VPCVTFRNILKSSIFWDTTSCTSQKVSWRFGGTRRFHRQGLRMSQARNQHEAGVALFLYGEELLGPRSTFKLEDHFLSASLIIQHIRSYLSFLEGHFLYSQPEDATRRGYKGPNLTWLFLYDADSFALAYMNSAGNLPVSCWKLDEFISGRTYSLGSLILFLPKPSREEYWILYYTLLGRLNQRQRDW
jgi:hypothetical protein